MGRRVGIACVVLAVLGATLLTYNLRDARSVGAATVTKAPVADTYVNAQNPTASSGSSRQLIADGSPTIQSFLRFDLRDVTTSIQSARLRLHVADISNGGSPAGGAVATTSNTTWSEATTTWQTRPAIDGPVVGSFGRVTRNTWVELDVTAAMRTGAIVSLTMSSTN